MLLDLATSKAGSEPLLHKHPLTSILEKNPVSVKKPFLVLTCIVTTSFEGKKLDYRCMYVHHSPSDFGYVDLGIWFLFVWRPLFHQSPSSDPSRVLPALIPLQSSQRALLISALLPWGTQSPTTTFAHTPVTKVCPVISQKTSKMVPAPRMCSQRHVHKDPAPLALTSVWLKVQERF